MKIRFVKNISLIILALTFCATPIVTQPEVHAQKSTVKNRKRKKATTTKTTTAKKTSSKPETSADVKKKQEATQKEIKQTEEQIRQNELSVKKNLKELGLLEGEITESKKKISTITAQINTLNNQISQLEGSIATDEAELKKLRDEYLKAVKKMRVSKKNKSDLAFIFASSSFNQAIRRMRYLKEFSEWKDRQSEAIAGKIEELKTQKELLATARQQHEAGLKIQRNEQNKLEEQYAKQDRVVTQLKQNGESLKSHLAKKQSEANVLKNRIAELIAEEQRKAEEERRKVEAQRKAEEERRAREEQERKEKEAREAELLAAAEKDKSKKEEKNSKKKEEKKEAEKEKNNKPTEYADARKRNPRSKDNASVSSASTASSSASTASTASGASFADMKGKLPKPVSGSFRVTSPFGQHALPDLPDVMYDNPGVDAEVAAGASALAVYNGKVSGVYMLPGFNTVVIVNHGNYYTVYGNILSPSVKVGDTVAAGHSLGKLASDEDDQSHGSIHFEVWRNREKLNPMEWIR